MPSENPSPWLENQKLLLAELLLASHLEAFSQALVAETPGEQSRLCRCLKLFRCGFPVLAHGTGDDPRLTYANAAALQLWETNWDTLIGLPSRCTAPEEEQKERRSALGQAKRLEAMTGYRGIRVSRKGRRFMIRNARIWTLQDGEGQICGQAASFSDWHWI